MVPLVSKNAIIKQKKYEFYFLSSRHTMRGQIFLSKNIAIVTFTCACEDTVTPYEILRMIIYSFICFKKIAFYSINNKTEFAKPKITYDMLIFRPTTLIVCAIAKRT